MWRRWNLRRRSRRRMFGSARVGGHQALRHGLLLAEVVEIRDLVSSIVDGLLRHRVEDVLDGLHVVCRLPRAAEPRGKVLTHAGLEILRRISEELSE